jgi:tetratricopeptide (TPR) repeat protein
MIVRNEEKVIRPCLESVAPFIDSFTIVDTGSSDGTMSLAQSILDGIPGEILERPWVDFGHNRTEAFAYNRDKADWHLVIDADDVMRFDSGKPDLPFTAAAAQIDVHHIQDDKVAAKYPRLHFFNTAWDWAYSGPVHEYPTCGDETAKMVHLPGVTYLHYAGRGARSQDGIVAKCRADAEVLLRALVKDPTNTRYAFYLANSFKDAMMVDEAIAAYLKRIELGGGYAEEVYVSHLYAGRLLALKQNYVDAHAHFVQACSLAPWRKEAPVELSRIAGLYQGGPYLFEEV